MVGGCDNVQDPPGLDDPIRQGGLAPTWPPPAVTDAELINLVLQQPAPDGEGSVSNWIDRLYLSVEGQPLFPRWQTRRRAANRFEVRYSFKWVERDKPIENRGYVWLVDPSLRHVEGPRVLAETGSSRARSFADQQQRRAEDPEYNLR